MTLTALSPSQWMSLRSTMLVVWGIHVNAFGKDRLWKDSLLHANAMFSLLSSFFSLSLFLCERESPSCRDSCGHPAPLTPFPPPLCCMLHTSASSWMLNQLTGRRFSLCFSESWSPAYKFPHRIILIFSLASPELHLIHLHLTIPRSLLILFVSPDLLFFPPTPLSWWLLWHRSFNLLVRIDGLC